MDVEEIHEFALSLENVTEDFPFGPQTLVMRHLQKIFLFISLDALPLQISLKGNPEENILLREEHPKNIAGGYHLNKKHWNTLVIDGGLKASLIKQLILQSHSLVGKIKKR